MAQGVKDMSVMAAVVWAQVQSSASCSGLRIWCCRNCGIGCSCSSDSIPGLGTSICHGANTHTHTTKKKKKKKEREREEESSRPALNRESQRYDI